MAVRLMNRICQKYIGLDKMNKKETIDSWNQRYRTSKYTIYPGQVLVFPIGLIKLLPAKVRVMMHSAVVREEATTESYEVNIMA